MATPKVIPSGNGLLNHLPKAQTPGIIEQCEEVELVFGETLHSAEDPIQYVYFPLTSFISLLTINLDDQYLEMGLIGNEGMLGATLALDNQYAPMNSIVQGAGSALRLQASIFIQCLANEAGLGILINRYLYVLMQQLAQAGACNRFHEVQQRIAKWLLMTEDRVYSGELQLTHSFLAKMLGVRRSAVTIAAGYLQQQGIIRYNRGHIQILSRSALEKLSCQCYFTAKRAYQKHLTLPASKYKDE